MYKKKKLLAPVNFNGTLRKHENDKFGAIRKDKNGPLRKHAGVDLYDDKGNPVKAALDGIVVRANGKDGHTSYGGLVIVDHTPTQIQCQKPQYTYTLYAHLESTTVTFGQIVKRGKRIGTVGNSGNAKGMKPHLHFEVVRSKGPLDWSKTGRTGIRSGMHRVDPLPYLNGRSIDLGEEADPYAELLRINLLATRYDFKKFAEENNIPLR